MTFEQACEAFCSRDRKRFDCAADAIMASARRGLTDAQIELLSAAIAASGDKIRLPPELEPFIDVPSSGGPASLTTLLCPLLLATFGFYVPKLSAPGSIAGGIDTMAIIPGFKADLAESSFVSVLRRCRFAHAHPSKTFCPADNTLIRKRRAARMMANPELAAASLLAKKLAIPHTRAAFDFRIGPAGNIGKNLRESRMSRRLFERIAKNLHVKALVVLTENRTFPSSALGRLESLLLLWRVLSNTALLKVDQDHVCLCIDISAKACMLANSGLDPATVRAKLENSLRSGSAKRTFIAHLEAQGASQQAFEQLIEIRNQQKPIVVTSPGNGYWLPPDLNLTKEWLKREQLRFQNLVSVCTEDGSSQIGLQLHRARGEFVRKGDKVIEVRYPTGIGRLDVPDWLWGRISRSNPAEQSQLLG